MKKSPRLIKDIKMPEVRPARIFADYDKDGVANVFDCQPRNPRRQDRRRLAHGDTKEERIRADKNITEITKSERFKKARGYY